MAVIAARSVTLEVPSIAPGVEFYTAAGLNAAVEDERASFPCDHQATPCINLLSVVGRKRLHHVSLYAHSLDSIATNAITAGGEVVRRTSDGGRDSLWVRDPHGVLYELVDDRPEPEVPVGQGFAINAPGRLVRVGKSAALPISECRPVRPRRLGHVLLFSPDVPASVAFAEKALGMGLADHSGDVIAFCCARVNSDHHVLAFAKSQETGFHHASFQVADPDEVGRGGRALVQKAERGDWGFGRHTIGSNFFHYIQDPWGSWFEYYSDMDYIEDYQNWTATDYRSEDSLAQWGPSVPSDFVNNYEIAGDKSA